MRNAFLLLLSAPTLLAQAPLATDPLTPPTPALPDRIPVHTRADEPGEPAYGTWAAGRDYKASFHDGMTFVPVLGREYPHNQPFAWRTTSVRVGAAELLPTREGAPRPRLGDYRVTYDLGNDITEAYDVRAEGLEQTFVLARRPAGGGDLVVEGAVTSALRAAPVEERSGEVTFADASGMPIVTYGRAQAVDADGDLFPMTTSWRNGHLTLRLAAADLAAADFPLVVDPLLARTVAGAMGPATAIGDVDVAADQYQGTYGVMFAWTRYTSAADADVGARITHPNFNAPAATFADVSTSTSASYPSLAFVAGVNRWVMAYQSQNLGTMAMQIRVHLHDLQDASVSSSSIGRINALGDHDSRPRVGGVASGTSNQALIVFQRDNTGASAAFQDTATSAVMGLLFNVNTGVGQFTAPFTIYSGSGIDAERPSINRQADGGAGSSWFVVCQTYNNGISGDDWDLLGKLVAANGTPSTTLWLSSLGTIHKTGPQVDGRHGRFSVAYATSATSYGKITDTKGTEVRNERVDWSDPAAGPTVSGEHPVVTLATSASRSLSATGIAYDTLTRSHWAVAAHNDTTADWVGAWMCGYTGNAIGGQAIAYQAGSPSTVISPLALAFSSTTHETLLTYSVNDAGSGYPIYGQTWTLTAPAATTTNGTSCGGNLLWGVPHGPLNTPWLLQRVGNELAGPRVTGAAAGSLHFLLVALQTIPGTPVANPLVPTNCSLYVPTAGPGYLGTLPLQIGSDAQWALPLPEYLPGLTLVFQDWNLDPATSVVRSTAALSVPLTVQ